MGLNKKYKIAENNFEYTEFYKIYFSMYIVYKKCTELDENTIRKITYH